MKNGNSELIMKPNKRTAWKSIEQVAVSNLGNESIIKDMAAYTLEGEN